MCKRTGILIGLVSFFILEGASHSGNTPTTLDSPAPITFVKSNGGVEFRAIGKPSSLKIVGKGAGFDGQFEIAGSNLKGKAVFDLASLSTGIEVRDNHMKDRYLEVSKFPKAELNILDLKLSLPIDQKNLEITDNLFHANLRLHGVEKAVKGKFSIKIQKDSSLALEASFQVKLTDFGISAPAFAGITIDDQVEIKVLSTGQFLIKS